MGLGRITRFAPTPAGARRVSVMRAGTAGVKELAPAPELLADFLREKKALVKKGMPAEKAHLEAFARSDYRARFVRQFRSEGRSLEALRALVGEARERDVYVMCMCPYKTPGGACHTYLLLELARELDPKLKILAEPKPRGV